MRISDWSSDVCSSDLGHEVHTAENDGCGVVSVLGEHGQSVAVAAGIDPSDDLVALVVVSEDEEPVAEGGLGGGDASLEVFGVGVGVALVERLLEPQHLGVPSTWRFRLWTAGTARSPLPRGWRDRKSTRLTPVTNAH